jgi:hypothetical protein
MTKEIVLSAIFFLLISIEMNAQSKRVDRMKGEFIQSAFLPINKLTTNIVKWENKDTLKYHIEGKMEFITRKSWDKYINEVSSLIKMPILETESVTKADINIYFGELSDYIRKYKTSYPAEITTNNRLNSWSNRNYNSKHQLLSTSYCIVPSKTTSDDRGDYNIKRLFLSSLGLLGAIETRSSLFNSKEIKPVTWLYAEDKRLIKLFYSDSIKAGMDLKEVNEVLKTMNLEMLCDEKL